MVLANKQDLETAMTVKEVSDSLELDTIDSHAIQIFGISVYKSEGLYEAFDWLEKKLTEVVRDSTVVGPVNETMKDNLFSYSWTEYFKNLFSR